MPWNMKDFPASMKNLDKLTRKKAIDIANALLDEGSDVIVEYAEEQWIVKSKGAKKASNHFDTKKEAIEKGKQVAQNKESTLVIYKKDGTKEKEIDY